MEIVLVRHGQPAWVVDGQPNDDPGLTELGHDQARAAAAALGDEAFDEVWVSSKLRAQETAEPILDALGSTSRTVPDFREIELPNFSQLPLDKVRSYFEESRQRTVERWWGGNPGGEVFGGFRERVVTELDARLAAVGGAPLGDAGLWRLDEPDKRVLMVGHGGTNAVIVEHLIGLEPVPWPWERLPHRHTGITRLQTQPLSKDGHAFTLASFDDIGHLGTVAESR